MADPLNPAVDAQIRELLVEELVKMRKERGLSQSEVARRIGVASSVVSRFEQGARDYRIGTVQRYARIVGGRIIVLIMEPAEEKPGA